jgi:hypothetical protein
MLSRRQNLPGEELLDQVATIKQKSSYLAIINQVKIDTEIHSQNNVSGAYTQKNESQQDICLAATDGVDLA